MPQLAKRESPSSHPRLKPARRAFAVLVAVLALPSPQAAAQSSGEGTPPGIIRDAEIEQLTRDYANPVLRAAGVNTGGPGGLSYACKGGQVSIPK